MSLKVKKNIFLAGIVMVLSFGMFAQTKDTILQTIFSDPLFYNIVTDGNGQIYAGTSEGIFEISGVNLKPYAAKRGYIRIDKNGKPVVDQDGIKYHRGTNYKHLLPYAPKEDIWTYYASNNNLFYLCAGGKLYLFEILPFQINYENHSIRSISKNLVGTYSGIYLQQEKLPEPAPRFTNGFVREFEGRGFICSYPLYIIEKNAMQTGKIELGVNFRIHDEPDNLLVCDIALSKDKKTYFIATQNKLIRADTNFSKEEILFQKEDLNSPVFLIPGNDTKMMFAAENNLISLHYRNGKLKFEQELPANIIAGCIVDNVAYLLTKEGLYRYTNDGSFEYLETLEQAHSIVSINDDQLIIGTNFGLFHYSLIPRTLSLLINNVEFNRNALYVESHSDASKSIIHAGSLNGLYSFPASKIPELIERNTMKINSISIEKSSVIGLSSLLVLFIISLGFIVFYYHKRLRSANRAFESLKPKEAVSREQIEQFITENLNKASVKSITDAFDLNAPKLYAIFAPEKPGSFINEQRIKVVKQLKAEGKTLHEIAEASGFSVEYLKKIQGKIGGMQG